MVEVTAIAKPMARAMAKPMAKRWQTVWQNDAPGTRSPIPVISHLILVSLTCGHLFIHRHLVDARERQRYE